MRQSGVNEAELENASDLDVARAVCRASAHVAQSFFRNAAAIDKGGEAGYDPVTEGDKAAEREARRLLALARPEDGILGEEFGRSHEKADRQWIIDPIDGTRAFVVGAPTWGTLIGLKTGNSFSVGAACQPMTGDLFYGDGKAAYLSGKPIATRSSQDSLRIATTDTDLLDEEYLEPFMKLKKSAAITRLGLDWYAYCLLSAGHIDAVIECGLMPYDIAALVPIIRGAGGVVSDLTGGNDIGPTVLASANQDVHAQVLSAMAV